MEIPIALGLAGVGYLLQNDKSSNINVFDNNILNNSENKLGH